MASYSIVTYKGYKYFLEINGSYTKMGINISSPRSTYCATRTIELNTIDAHTKFRDAVDGACETVYYKENGDYQMSLWE
jgi:hypothetical protein